MARTQIPAGVVHEVPPDLAEILLAEATALAAWAGLTPLARNEWLCWVEDARRDATRQKRLARLIGDLEVGKRRPCCWPGCPHRARTGKPSRTGPGKT